MSIFLFYFFKIYGKINYQKKIGGLINEKK